MRLQKEHGLSGVAAGNGAEGRDAGGSGEQVAPGE
jgi:hypothetical protein